MQNITTSKRFLLKYKAKANKEKKRLQKTTWLRITHPTKSSKALQDIIVDETGLRRITEGLVQEVVDEVDARLYGQHHALLQAAGGAQVPEPGQVNALHSLRKKHQFRQTERQSMAIFYEDPPILSAPSETQNTKIIGN